MTALCRAAAAVAALIATVIIAPAASADPVPEPTCAVSSSEVTWTSHYEEGRYEMSTLVLTGGLEGCAGSAIVVAIGSGQRLYATVPALVTADPLTLDVSEYRIPAEQVERLALTVHTAPPAGPTTGSGTEPAPIIDSQNSGAVGSSATAPLPNTGTDAAWFAGLAIALVVLGAALRSRTRQEGTRV